MEYPWLTIWYPGSTSREGAGPRWFSTHGKNYLTQTFGHKITQLQKLVPRPGHADFLPGQNGGLLQINGWRTFFCFRPRHSPAAGGMGRSGIELVDNSLEANKQLALQMGQLLQRSSKSFLSLMLKLAGKKPVYSHSSEEKYRWRHHRMHWQRGVPQVVHPHFHGGSENTISAAVRCSCCLKP